MAGASRKCTVAKRKAGLRPYPSLLRLGSSLHLLTPLFCRLDLDSGLDGGTGSTLMDFTIGSAVECAVGQGRKVSHDPEY